MRTGLAYTCHMCLIGPQHNIQCVHKMAFRAQFYFNRYGIFCNTWHSVFYLLLRSLSNIFCPGLSWKTQNADFLTNGTWNKNLTLMQREKKSFSFILCRVPLINQIYWFANSVFRSSPYTWFQESWYLAQKCNLIGRFCANMVENSAFSPK